MSIQIIIKGKTKYGKTRGEQEDNLRRDGLQGMDDDKYDKVKWFERKTGMKHGFIRQGNMK